MKKILVPVFIALLVVGHFALGHSHASTPPPAPKVRVSSATMASRIQAVIADNPTVDTSVSVIDLNTGVKSHYGVSDPFEAASTTKLLTASEFLKSVENGNESMSKDLGGESAAGALQQMVVNSDNSAWQLLTNEMSTNALASYALGIGIHDFNVENNTLTSDDVGLVLQKLYSGQLLNKSHTTLLLSYLKRANEADFIPPAVPAGVSVYHKAGLLEDRIHDAAIITDGQHAYVLVIFTNGHGTYDTPGRTQMLQTITKATIAHFIGT